MAIVTPNRLSTEEQEALSRLISLHQTDGLSESAPIDKDFLIQDGNFDLFFLNYFPNDFLAFERLNYELLNFLESESQGMAWLPGGHGKGTWIATRRFSLPAVGRRWERLRLATTCTALTESRPKLCSSQKPSLTILATKSHSRTVRRS